MNDDQKITEWNLNEPPPQSGSQFKDITPGDTESDGLNQAYQAMANSMASEVKSDQISSEINKNVVKNVEFSLGAIPHYQSGFVYWLTTKLKTIFHK